VRLKQTLAFLKRDWQTSVETPQMIKGFIDFLLERWCSTLVLLKKIKYRKEIRIYKTVTISNMMSALGNGNLRRIRRTAHQNLINYVRTAGSLVYWKAKTRYQIVEWQGYDILETALSKYGSAIFCSCHFGNYYIFPFELAKRGHTVIVVVGEQNRQLELIRRAAKHLNLSLQAIMTKDISLLNLMREIREGKSIYILIDELGGSTVNALNNNKLVKMVFLNQYSQFKKGIGWLHLATRVPIIPVVSMITGANNHLIRVEKPIDVLTEADRDKDLLIDNTVRQILSLYEQYILKYPSQWLKWFDLKRYCVDVSGKTHGNYDLNRLSGQVFRVSREKLRVLKDKQGFVLIDTVNRRYYATDEIGYRVVKLLYKGIELHTLMDLLRKRHKLSDEKIYSVISQTLNMNLLEFPTGRLS